MRNERELFCNAKCAVEISFSARTKPSVLVIVAAARYNIVSRPSRAAGWVNLRSTPSTEAKVLTRCYAGKTLTVVAEMNGWFKVVDPANGAIGYISSKFVSRA